MFTLLHLSLYEKTWKNLMSTACVWCRHQDDPTTNNQETNKIKIDLLLKIGIEIDINHRTRTSCCVLFLFCFVSFCFAVYLLDCFCVAVVFFISHYICLATMCLSMVVTAALASLVRTFVCSISTVLSFRTFNFSSVCYCWHCVHLNRLLGLIFPPRTQFRRLNECMCVCMCDSFN